MAPNLQGDEAHKARVQAFLHAHPEVRVGREALDKARNDQDDGNTFEVHNKPFANVVLVQQFDADTRKRLFAVALVDDDKAEAYYAQHNDDGAAGAPQDREPSSYLHECAPGHS